MSIVEHLEQLGGVARRAVLLRRVDRGDLDRAVQAGDVVRDARGRYALPGAEEAVRVAAALGGVVGLSDAALHHGWAVKVVPKVPHVVLSRGRKVPEGVGAVIIRAELRPSEVDGHWTSREKTLEQCLRRLPFAEALCVADSARREGVGQEVLERMAERAKGPGAAQLRRVVAACTPDAANPFESCARAIALDVPGLDARPQVVLEGLGFRADLVDERLRIVIECDSFEWHGKKSALESDARRYNVMVADGWIVLRLVHHDVMNSPDEVRDLLVGVVALAELMNKALVASAAAA
jgi:very-short-patch-repair endonuclease